MYKKRERLRGRPKSVRKISSVPVISGFRPYGMHGENDESEPVFLLYEEYEALRLNDYEKFNQEESAEKMQVSRPTFTRIYMNAREKIARAFVEGRQIIVEGGKVELDGEWYECKACGAVFTIEHGEKQICALCGNETIEHYKIR